MFQKKKLYTLIFFWNCKAIGLAMFLDTTCLLLVFHYSGVKNNKPVLIIENFKQHNFQPQPSFFTNYEKLNTL